MVAVKDAPEVEIGSVWLTGGRHQRVAGERVNYMITPAEREVRLVILDNQGEPLRNAPQFWVPAWKVAKHGSPSLAYTQPVV